MSPPGPVKRPRKRSNDASSATPPSALPTPAPPAGSPPLSRRAPPGSAAQCPPPPPGRAPTQTPAPPRRPRSGSRGSVRAGCGGTPNGPPCPPASPRSPPAAPLVAGGPGSPPRAQPFHVPLLIPHPTRHRRPRLPRPLPHLVPHLRLSTPLSHRIQQRRRQHPACHPQHKRRSRSPRHHFETPFLSTTHAKSSGGTCASSWSLRLIRWRPGKNICARYLTRTPCIHDTVLQNNSRLCRSRLTGEHLSAEMNRCQRRARLKRGYDAPRRTCRKRCVPSAPTTPRLRSCFAKRCGGADYAIAVAPEGCRAAPTSYFLNTQRSYSWTVITGTVVNGERVASKACGKLCVGSRTNAIGLRKSKGTSREIVGSIALSDLRAGGSSAYGNPA